MSDYLSSLGYPFRVRPMVFVFSVMMVWGVFLAARDVLIGWIAAFCFLLPFMCAFFMKMVRQSAMGEEDICPFPELDEWLVSLMLPFVRLVVCIIVSFLRVCAYCGLGGGYYPGVAVPGGGCDLLSRCIHENLRSGTFFRSFSRGLVGAGQKGSLFLCRVTWRHMRRGMDHPEPSFRAFDGFRHGAREAVCRLRVDEYVRTVHAQA